MISLHKHRAVDTGLLLLPRHTNAATICTIFVTAAGMFLPGWFIFMAPVALISALVFVGASFLAYERNADELQTLRARDICKFLDDHAAVRVPMIASVFYASVRRFVEQTKRRAFVEFVGVGERLGIYIAIIILDRPVDLAADVVDAMLTVTQRGRLIIITNAHTDSIPSIDNDASSSVPRHDGSFSLDPADPPSSALRERSADRAPAPTVRDAAARPMATPARDAAARPMATPARPRNDGRSADRAPAPTDTEAPSTRAIPAGHSEGAPRPLNHRTADDLRHGGSFSLDPADPPSSAPRERSADRAPAPTARDAAARPMATPARPRNDGRSADRAPAPTDAEAPSARAIPAGHSEGAPRPLNHRTADDLLNRLLSSSPAQALEDCVRIALATTGSGRSDEITSFEGPRFWGVTVNRVIPRPADIEKHIRERFPERHVTSLAMTDGTTFLIERSDFRSAPLEQAIASVNRLAPLQFPAGWTVDGRVLVADLRDGPHMLIVGATQSGKSSFLHTLIATICESYRERVELALIDLKSGLEFSLYDDLDNLRLPVVGSIESAVEALRILKNEMHARFRAMKQRGATEWDGRFLVVVIDEWNAIPPAMASEMNLLLRQGRAAGMHFVLTTHRPTVENINGFVRSQLGMRAMFRVSDANEGRLVFGTACPPLLGRGDLWFHTLSLSAPVRLQAPWVDAVQRATQWTSLRRTPTPPAPHTAHALSLGGVGVAFFEENSIARSDYVRHLQSMLEAHGLEATRIHPPIHTALRAMIHALHAGPSRAIVVESFADMLLQASDCVIGERRMPALAVFQRLIAEAVERRIHVWMVMHLDEQRAIESLRRLTPTITFLAAYRSVIFPASLDPHGACARATIGNRGLICLHRESGDVLWHDHPPHV